MDIKRVNVVNRGMRMRGTLIIKNSRSDSLLLRYTFCQIAGRLHCMMFRRSRKTEVPFWVDRFLVFQSLHGGEIGVSILESQFLQNFWNFRSFKKKKRENRGRPLRTFSARYQRRGMSIKQSVQYTVYYVLPWEEHCKRSYTNF